MEQQIGEMPAPGPAWAEGHGVEGPDGDHERPEAARFESGERMYAEVVVEIQEVVGKEADGEGGQPEQAPGGGQEQRKGRPSRGAQAAPALPGGHDG